MLASGCALCMDALSARLVHLLLHIQQDMPEFSNHGLSTLSPPRNLLLPAPGGPLSWSGLLGGRTMQEGAHVSTAS